MYLRFVDRPSSRLHPLLRQNWLDECKDISCIVHYDQPVRNLPETNHSPTCSKIHTLALKQQKQECICMTIAV